MNMKGLNFTVKIILVVIFILNLNIIKAHAVNTILWPVPGYTTINDWDWPDRWSSSGRN